MNRFTGVCTLVEQSVAPLLLGKTWLGFVLFCAAGYLVSRQAAAQTELITNGNFETGSFSGWTVVDQAGGSGSFLIDTPMTNTPLSVFPTAGNPAGGAWYAVSDQGGPGTHVLIQPFSVPQNATSLTFSFEMFVNDQSGSGPIIDPAGLDYTVNSNQHARVDLLTAVALPFDTGAGVIANFYLGNDLGPNPNPFTSYTFDITGFVTPGGSYQIRFAEVDNQGFFHLGVDNISILAITGASAPEPAPVSILLTDVSAINSLLTTGLLMPPMQVSQLQNLHHTALGDLNDRLFRARGHHLNGVNGNASTLGSGPTDRDSSLIKYLDFAQNQHIDYRVALGLREGEEVVLAPADSLAGIENLWASTPAAMLGGPISLAPVASVRAVVAAPAGKEVIDSKYVVEEDPFKPFEIFTEFDYGYWDQDRLTQATRGYEVDSYTGSVGAEYRISDWLQVGGAFTFAWSDAELEANLGGTDIEGTLLSGYATAYRGNSWVDVLYSYGNFNHEISRNTLTSAGRAFGDTDSHTHSIALNAGHNYALNRHLVSGPFLGLDYGNGAVAGYEESGGGSADLIYDANTFESMVGRIGWSVTHTGEAGFLGRMTSQLRAGWAHEFMPETDIYTATLATSPFLLLTGNHAQRVGGFRAEGGGAHVGQDWLELGAGVRFDLGNGWNCRFDYEGQFARNNASAHFATARLGYEWGDHLFRPKMEDDSGKDIPAEFANAASDRKKSGGLFAKIGGLAGKQRKANSAEVTSAEPTPDAGLAAEAEPYVSAQPVPVVEGSAQAPIALPTFQSQGIDDIEIYSSWDEVPGRKPAVNSTAETSEPEIIEEVSSTTPEPAAANQ